MTTAVELSPIAAREVAQPPAALFPNSADRAMFEDRLTRALIDADVAVTSGSVTPDFDENVFRAELAAFDFDRRRPLEDVCDWAVEQLVRGVTHVTHPRYFGLFNPKPTFPSEVADRIVSALNPQLASATTSPAAVEIERHVIRAVGARAGFGSNASGSFTSGGSEANMTSLLLALTRANPDYPSDGLTSFPGRPVLYVSRDCHLAWLKIAQMCGLGRSSARLIRTDGGGRMDVGALDAAIEEDRRNGFLPVMVAATAGTTGAGVIDPIEQCAEVARRHGMWMHVDAAWAGALLASRRLRSALDGVEQADSITIDAHKWFATSMGCGMIITRHRETLSAAFHIAAEFMPSATASLDPYLMSTQWSRRFLGLRLFLPLAVAGWQGFALHVERATSLAKLLGDVLSTRGWRVVNDSPAAVVCLAPPVGSANVYDISNRVKASGRFWVSTLRFEGLDVIRACVSNGVTGPTEILDFAQALVDALKPQNIDPRSATSDSG